MFCSNCGNKILDDAHYCNVCGYKVVKGKEQPPEEDTPDMDARDETKVTDTIPPIIPPGIPTYPPNANVPPVVPKGVKWSKGWIAAVVLLVLIVGGALAMWSFADNGQEADENALHSREQITIVSMNT